MENTPLLNLGDVVYRYNENSFPCAYRFIGMHCNEQSKEYNWYFDFISAEDMQVHSFSRYNNNFFQEMSPNTGKMTKPILLCVDTQLKEYQRIYNKKHLDKYGAMCIKKTSLGNAYITFIGYQWVGNQARKVHYGVLYCDWILRESGLSTGPRKEFRIDWVHDGGNEKLPMYTTKEACEKNNKVKIFTF